MSASLFDQYKAALRRGHLAALAGDLDGALEAYGEAARLVPERALPIASQGTVLHRLDRWPEASEAFDLALRMAPDDEAALRARAVARAERGLRSGAAADFERLAFVPSGKPSERVAGNGATDARQRDRRADRFAHHQFLGMCFGELVAIMAADPARRPIDQRQHRQLDDSGAIDQPVE